MYHSAAGSVDMKKNHLHMLRKRRHTFSQRIIAVKNEGFVLRLVSLLFKKVDFDSESITTLQEHEGRGKHIFVSYQYNSSSLLLLTSLLRKHALPVPRAALDFRINMFIKLKMFLRAAGMVVRGFFVKDLPQAEDDFSVIKREVLEHRGIVMSLLSKKLFWRRYVGIESDSLQSIVELQQSTDEPVLLFPQIMFWNRNPERTKRIFTSRATGDRGGLSAVATVLFSATPAFMRISTPLNIKEEIEQSSADEPKEIARKIRNKLLDVYSHEKRSILGPVIKSQQEMMEKILYNDNVLRVVESQAENMKAGREKLRKKALDYYREIAADFSIVYIRFFERTMRYIYDRVFNGIQYNIEDIRKIREASQRGPLIIMPAHKSHMDYLIVSSIFYREKIIPPHIVAGSNLTFFPMGKIFRKSGAFFMRRSFKGLDLYAAVFKQYIKTLISEGYSIEFFIEGGRSRTGKIVMPKMGILKYLINAIDEGYNRDMIFIPVSVNYGRILEEASYHKELKGAEKKNESTSAFVKSRRLLKKQYGKVYLSFGEAVSYHDLKEKFGTDADLTAEIGNYVIRRIQEIVMVTPFSLASTSILLSSLKGFSLDIVRHNFSILYDYLVLCDAPFSDSLKGTLDREKIIDNVVSSYEADRVVAKIEVDGGGKEPGLDLYRINEDERPRIAFYKNSILHFFLPQSFTAIAILYAHGHGGCTGDTVAGAYKRLLEMFSMEFIFSEKMYDIENVIEEALHYFKEKDVIDIKGDVISVRVDMKDSLVFFGRLVREFFESYSIVFNSLMGLTKKMHTHDLIYEIRKNGIARYHLGEIMLPEALALPYYNNALTKCEDSGFIKREEKGRKDVTVEVVDRSGIESYSDFIRDVLQSMTP